MARWEEHLRLLIVLERKCLDLGEATGQLSEKQELLAALVEGKMSLQKDAPGAEGVGGEEDKRSIGAFGT